MSKDKREISEEYTQIMKEIIDERDELDDIRDSDVQIICLKSALKKRRNGKLVFGQCEKVQDKNKWAIPCDFTITIFEPNVSYFSDEQIRILIFHELLHVGAAFNGEHWIRHHDLEDFKLIVNEFGTDWAAFGGGPVPEDDAEPEVGDEQKVESV